MTMIAAPAAAGAAAESPDPGKTKALVFGSGESAYSYLVYVPTAYNRSDPTPLVVMTHGCQTTAEEQLHATRYNGVAEREGFIVLYPDTTAGHAAQPGPLRNCWRFFDPNSWHRDSGDAGAIAGMTRAVMERWRVDARRVYMVGISAGGFMTSIMSAAYPDLFAATAVVAAGAYADPTCLFVGPGIPAAESARLARQEMGARARVVPRMIMGGDADQGIPPACANKALEQGLRTNNLVIGGEQESPIPLAPASVREEPNPDGYDSTVSAYRDADGCLIGEAWSIHGMNHFWPGGSTDPEYANFTDPLGPNGAEATWRFVSRFTKRSTAMPCADATRCRARWLAIDVPANAESARAKVNGRRARVRVTERGVRVRLPASVRSRTRVVVRGRTAGGESYARRQEAVGCG
jgi:poly(hydroxyalkanoate) depolymerase family esterase